MGKISKHNTLELALALDSQSIVANISVFDNHSDMYAWGHFCSDANFCPLTYTSPLRQIGVCCSGRLALERVLEMFI